MGWVVAIVSAAACTAPAMATPFADTVVSYTPGINANPAYANPSVVLGSPERFTGENTPFGSFPGSVTPCAGAFGVDEVLSLGAGGSLVVRFEQPVTNDPLNPFGIDVLVFGNSFFGVDSFSDPNPSITGLASEGGVVEVSPDGIAWFLVQGVMADGLFPTLGYADEASVFGGSAGVVPTDFTRPVNPALAWQGLTYQQLVAAYDGAGGGAGIDIGALGLSQISFVRVSNPIDAPWDIEVDAFSDVAAIPAPGVATLVALAGVLGLGRRRARA